MSGEDEFYRTRGYRKKSIERKDTAARFEFPKCSEITDRNIVFLHVHCGKQPGEIVAAYPQLVNLAAVHLALGKYFSNPAPIDAELEKERVLNSREILSDVSATLPQVGLDTLLEISDSK